MHRLLIGALFLGLLTPVAAFPRDDAKKELEKLQGTWTMSSLEIDGKAVPADKIEGTTLEIKDDKYIVKTKDDKHEVTLKLDPGKKPKEIDMIFPNGTDAPKIHQGIYELDGDDLKICRGQAADAGRPAQFGTWPNTGVFQVVWKRTKKP